jgi:hypothetical protein
MLQREMEEINFYLFVRQIQGNSFIANPRLRQQRIQMEPMPVNFKN